MDIEQRFFKNSGSLSRVFFVDIWRLDTVYGIQHLECGLGTSFFLEGFKLGACLIWYDLQGGGTAPIIGLLPGI